MKNNEYYSSVYKSDLWNLIRELEARDLISVFNVNNRIDKILDVACGNGSIANALSQKFHAEAYGFDKNYEAVRIANEKGIKAIVGDVQDRWDYDDNTFDLVVASEIIEHVSDPDHLILESKRVLKNNGILVIKTPNLASWFNRLIVLFGYQPIYTEVSTVSKKVGIGVLSGLVSDYRPVGHLRCFTKRALSDIVKIHKMKLIYIKGIKTRYFPKGINTLNKFFSLFPDLSAELVLVAKNEKN